MSVIRKKPYVEKVVESLSSDSLDLLRETLNTNKENVNCSLIGGNNLLKRFEKEYEGNLLTDSTQVSSIYFNFGKYNTWEKVEKLSSSFTLWIGPAVFITSDLTDDNTAAVVMVKGDTNFGEFNKTRILAIIPKIENLFDLTQSLFSYAFLGDEQEARILAQAMGVADFEWQGEGWYDKNCKKIEDDIFVLNDMEAQIIGNVVEIEVVKNFISFNTPFVSINTQLLGHIPEVGETIEKVYFNPNAYGTDEEWFLWYASLKQTKDGFGDLIGAFACCWKWDYNQDYNIDSVIDKYSLVGVGVLTDILAFQISINSYLYVSNEALTGTYAQVYQQFGITERGWYKVTTSGGTPTGVTKLTEITEITSEFGTATVVESQGDDTGTPYDINNHLFAKVVSYNTPFVETPIQNNLKPAGASVGEKLNKVYINLGYFDNDLNKISEYAGGNGVGIEKVLFERNEHKVQIVPFWTDDSIPHFVTFVIVELNNFALVYVSQDLVANKGAGLCVGLTQDDVNTWVYLELDPYALHRFENQEIFELPLEGTITEIDDSSLISVNKPFEEIGGWIYDDVTPVNLQLEQNNLKTGILIWNEEYCSLLAYHRFQDMKEYELDLENSYFKVINEDLSINELRRVAFTPTQEVTVQETTKCSQAIELEMRVVPTGSEGYCGVLYQCILNLEDFLKGLSAAFYNLSGVTVEITSAAQLNTLLGLLNDSTLIQAMTIIAGLGAQRTEAKSYFINYNPNDGDVEPNVMTLLSAGYLSDLIFIDKSKIISTLTSAFSTILGDGFAFDEAIIRVENVSID